MTTSLLDTLGVTVPSTVPTHWYNLAADLPSPCPPALHPGTREPLTPGRPGAAVPDGPDHAGGQHRAVDRDPRAGAGDLRPVAPVAADPRAPPRARARHPGADLLQVRGREPGRVAQAEHRRRAGVLQRGRGHHEAHHRDRRRAVGCVAGHGVRAARTDLRGVAGPRLVRLQAVPPDADGDVREHLPPVAVGPHRTPAARCSPADPETTGSLGMAISEAVEAAATDPDAHYSLGSVLNHVLLHQSVIGQEALAQLDAIEESADVVFACAGGGSNLGGLCVPVPRPEPARRHDHAGGRLRAGRVPVADAGRVPVRLRRRRRPDSAAEDAHARQGLRPAAHPRRWPAVPRHGADGVARRRARADRRDRRRPGDRVRRRDRVRPRRGHHPRAGVDARRRRGHRARPRGHRAARPSSSACPATASWTCPPTTTSCSDDEGPHPCHQGTRAFVMRSAGA